MKTLTLIICLVWSVAFSYGQGLTKNAEGEGSFIYKGTSIGIDIGKTEATFGMNNLQQSIGENAKFIFGGNIKAENGEGLAALFSQGDAVPSAALHGFAGYSWSNAIYKSVEVQRRAILTEMDTFKVHFLKMYVRQMRSAIDANCIKPSQQTLKANLRAALKTLTETPVLDAMLVPSADDSDDVREVKADLKAISGSLVKWRDKSTHRFTQQLTTVTENSGPKDYFQIMVFGFADYGSSQFKHLTVLDSVNYSNSFQNVNVRTDKIGLGANAQWRNIMFGLTYDHASASNFDLLTKKQYTFKKVLNSGNQSLTEQKDITAYSGDYGTLKVNELAADLILNFKLDADAKNHVLINPYTRLQTSTNRALLPNTLNLGCGFYFFQQTGKFLGGFYLELPDAHNNYEKMKPEADQRIRPPLKRLSFSVVGKLSLSSVLSVF